MCQKIQFHFQEWDEETRDAFIEGLARMTADYLKSKQDHEHNQWTKHDREGVAKLDG